MSMTDKQLHVLLNGLLDELSDALAEAEICLGSIGDEREQITVPVDDRGNPITANGLAAVGAILRGQTIQIDDPDGKFIALGAIRTLHDRWENRFTLLMDNVVAYDSDTPTG